MIPKLSLAALTAALAMSTSAPAAAAVLIVNASGLFSGADVHDRLGLGGGFGGPLDTVQAAFTLSFTFDLDVATRENQLGTDFFLAGASYGRPTPGRLTITIGGVLFELPGDLQGVALQNTGVLQQTLHRQGGGQLLLGAERIDQTLTADATAPPGGNICLTATCYGTIDTGLGVYGNLAADTYTVTYDPRSVAAIPEPATWALMIAGFGMAGGALRRHRARAVPTAG